VPQVVNIFCAATTTTTTTLLLLLIIIIIIIITTTTTIFTFINDENAGMHFGNELCNGNTSTAVEKYQWQFKADKSFDMDMSYTRVLHIKVAYRVPHK
jgi:hypothetical protein